MPYASLRDFIARLERDGRLVRVRTPVSPKLEITEIHRRLLAQKGPAVLFESPVREDGSRYDMPVLVNLFGTVERVAWGMDREPHQLREVGETLAFLRQPEPPGGWREALDMLPLLRTVMAMKPRTVGDLLAGAAPCQEVVLRGADIDLSRLPVRPAGRASRRPDHLAAGDAGPQPQGRPPGQLQSRHLPHAGTEPEQTLMRWLKHRGGAQHQALAEAGSASRCRQRW